MLSFLLRVSVSVIVIYDVIRVIVTVPDALLLITVLP